jgi:hypothetical protein
MYLSKSSSYEKPKFSIAYFSLGESKSKLIRDACFIVRIALTSFLGLNKDVTDGFSVGSAKSPFIFYLI